MLAPVKPLLILVTGEPLRFVLEVHGTFSDHVRKTVGAAWSGPWKTVDARVEPLPPLGDLSGILITGSHASVTELSPWMQSTAAWLRQAVISGKPVLGLCFGHQLLGHAMGGEVRRHPAGPENGTVPLDLLVADKLLGPLLAQAPCVNMMHEDSVARLPPGATVLARTAHEPHAALRFGTRAWGVQFHPEFDGSIVRSYLVGLRDQFRRAGRDPDRLLASADDTPWAKAILGRFAAIAEG
jgi:GMP synthase (glutamine-hydrolysing)